MKAAFYEFLKLEFLFSSVTCWQIYVGSQNDKVGQLNDEEKYRNNKLFINVAWQLNKVQVQFCPFQTYFLHGLYYTVR